jgi:acetolactate synthase-1/2/3 large subunit
MGHRRELGPPVGESHFDFRRWRVPVFGDGAGNSGRLKCNLVHLVWIDGAYDMVRFQEMAKYGRASGVEFSPVDVVRFAEAFGAQGLKIESPDQIAPTFKKALEMQGPVLIGVPVDYGDNYKLMEMVHPGALD